jgi:hypothetical protein
MNHRFILSAAVMLLTSLVPATVAAQGARIRLDSLKHLTEKAEEVVDVDIDAAMLKQTVGFLSGKGRGDSKLRALIDGITGIYVKSFEFKGPNAYSAADVEGIRTQVASSGWTRVVSVREKNELSEIYFWKDGAVNGGLVVIAAESNELTVVNVVGRVDLSTLSGLGAVIPRFPGVNFQK